MLESGWELNGVKLNNSGFGWLLEESTGLPSATPRSVTMVDLPFTEGLIPVPDLPASNVTAISVWVDNPQVGVSVAKLHEHVSNLQALCDQAETLTLVHGFGKRWTTRVYSVECSVPEIVGLGIAGVMVKLQITHEPGWMLEGSKVSTGLVSGVNHVRAFDGSGTVRDARLVFHGAAAKVQLTSLVDGSSLILNGVTGSTRVDVANREVTGVTSWDYGPAGFLRVAGKVTGTGVCPRLRVEITNGHDFRMSLEGHKWLR